MSNYDSKQLIEYLNEKWKGKGCPMCDENQWAISDKAMEIREFHGGNLVVGQNSSIQPVIPINCGNCGNTMLVNGLIAGVIERPVEDKENEQ